MNRLYFLHQAPPRTTQGRTQQTNMSGEKSVFFKPADPRTKPKYCLCIYVLKRTSKSLSRDQIGVLCTFQNFLRGPKTASFSARARIAAEAFAVLWLGEISPATQMRRCVALPPPPPPTGETSTLARQWLGGFIIFSYMYSGGWKPRAIAADCSLATQSSPTQVDERVEMPGRV